MAHIQLGNQTITAAEALSLLAEYQLLSQFQRELIANKAIATIELTPEEKATTIEQFSQQNKLSTQEAITAVQQQLCITPIQFEAIATRELRVEKFKIATWGNKLEQYFLQYKPQLDKVVYSLLRTDNSEIAQELFFRIQDGDASFADCAKEYSQGAEAQTGGLIGPVPISQAHPAIAQKLGTSKQGQVLPPMKLENWYVIVRLEKFIGAQLDDATRAMLLNHLFEQWLAEQIQNTPISLVNDNPAIPSSTPALVMS
ncbi:MAG: peptidylprolyl isomerase [Calothrix sp. C42_A2020_038]|nr:peptidylprolyl isomerase [Calothrix sp. C42_A2020_038]